ncbi:unnamed protein product [Caenorhabditis sp. 36 PRJEB53466]|nr:unnamed protein product [Caenorhabditis sp. 36 PRJEB53466]
MIPLFFLVFLVPISAAPCRMSPLTKYLSDYEQQTLHKLIVTARNAGADEEMVRESMDEYLAQVLSPEKLLEFKADHDEFEAQRRGKRSNEDSERKQEPKKVFDIIDQFTSDYQKFYEEPTAVRNRNNLN